MHCVKYLILLTYQFTTKTPLSLQIHMQEVVYRMLCLLNLIIQRGDEATLTFLIQRKQLVETLGPEMWSLSHRVRMEIVRIVTSVANTSHYSALLQLGAVQIMVNVSWLKCAVLS